MKIKAAQIARDLGISKATVSLALNNKPGVSEETKNEIMKYKAALESSTPVVQQIHTGTMIKIITGIKKLKIVYESEMDLWTDVIAVLERETKKRGYVLSISYVDMYQDDLNRVIQECEDESVAGIILEATELSPDDVRQFEAIQKPMVLYDNESAAGNHNCVLADNEQGARRAVDYLFSRGHKEIVYLAHKFDIYNFQQRRKGFNAALLEHNVNPYSEKVIHKLGGSIEEVYHNMLLYLERNKLPDACLMENYQVSIGVMRALREKKIKVPEQISVIGIDMVPDYVTGDCQLTTVCIPHTERACLAMIMLDKEIEEQSTLKSKILTDCPLIEGESVRD